MFIPDAWYVAAWASDIQKRPLARTILGRPVVFFRCDDNSIAALDDRCSHRGTPLSLGEVNGSTIACGYHGVTFDRAGRCVRIPGQKQISSRMSIRNYPLVEQDELAWIWMGDPALAASSDIPRFPYHNDHVNWPHLTRTQRLSCNYRLVIDNLMDLTHLAFVHRRTIGGNSDAHASAEFSVVRTERGVKLVRWMLNSVPPPTYVDAVGFTGRVDRWMEFEFVAPSSVLQFTGALDAGTGAPEGKREGGFALRIFHGITPETIDTCLYFWSACHGYRQTDHSVTEGLFKAISMTFDEDVAVLEAQHARLREFPAPLYSTMHDRARVGAEEILDRLERNHGPLASSKEKAQPEAASDHLAK